MPNPRDRIDQHGDEPDPRLLWRWVAAALRPWVGWVLVAAGALLLLLGYLGVSREALPAKQIPYLVSGGIGGMFVAVLGAYFLGVQELRNDSNRLDRLEQMVEELHRALLSRPDAPDVSSPGPGSGNGSGHPPAPARRVVVAEGGELFHRAGCTYVQGKAVEELTPAAARRRDLRGCPACSPAASAASA